MKIENQVCSLEQAKRLEELGIEGGTAFYWKVNETQSVVTESQMRFWIEKYVPVCNDYYPAFTVAELGVMLPDFITSDALYTYQQRRATLDRVKRNHEISYWNLGDKKLYSSYSNSEAECRASLVIYLLKEKIITPEEVNNRLNS